MPKSKEDKRDEAAARQAEHDKLSAKQKLEKLAARGITSGREFNRIVKSENSKTGDQSGA